jgi:hypothetical protein
MKERTEVSTEKMVAVSEPPIKITEKGNLHIDAIKSWATVVDAWDASASVLRDVAKAIRENQEDNEHTRRVVTRSQRIILCVLVGQLVGQVVLSWLL